MFVIETSLPFVARIALASTAMLTSSVSTALVGWCGHPYVSTIRTLSEQHQSDSAEAKVNGIQLETLTLTLRPRYTNVYDTAFLTETRRPFAKWELAKCITLEKPVLGTPSEETVAETLDAQGRVLGRWIVFWNDDRTRGTCWGEGKVQRFFNVHEEILPPFIR
ncbi:uncharacterized protein FOMMEDRAFT_16553 [Fomitiporia mediterranea MF3/22]|uniref:uncharacterized protein n=1 Tax=Fomitiporia mediterranea (strain MF3/22) TaxID=694068 RepID=UPI0004407587|nr:uncharacterized protein FOMMEDRAFT_16553 [Fomitiporia mediterranea MF3/22]EJD08028.1 hypothetical protein FOMMEDRAFT_16553 [Fomitiporia mediterranea MF3/22]